MTDRPRVRLWKAARASLNLIVGLALLWIFLDLIAYVGYVQCHAGLPFKW